MSYFACKDPERKKYIYANDCDSTNLNIEYYCPNPKCNAKLKLCSLNGKYEPHFSAKAVPHINGCIYSKHSNSNVKFNTTNFSFESFYDSIINMFISTPSNKNRITATGDVPKGTYDSEEIHTPTELYNFCISHDINFKINDNLKVKDIIADVRTNFIFTHGIIKGLRLVETIFHRYDKNTNRIYFYYPVDSSMPNKVDVFVHFQNTSDFDIIQKKIFKNKDEYKYAHICILGKWENDHCEIISPKQIIIIGN